MSVYRPRNRAGEPTSPFYHYDFRLGGDRFHGSTGSREKGRAREVERQRKEEARGAVAAQRASRSAPLTIDLAADLFWVERGDAYRGNAGKTFKAALAWIVVALGPSTLIRHISSRRVAELVTKRRAEGVSNATVNRTVTEPLRRVLRRAAAAWDQTGLPAIAWKEHLLAEPKERVRELKAEEETRIFAGLRADYHPVVAFALLSGCRLAECVGLKWSDIDWGGRAITIRGKGGVVDTIPLSAQLRTLLFPLQGQHPEAVFTYVARRNRASRKLKKGERYPITYEGLKTAWRRTKVDQKIEDFRFHDNRHTTATRLLRSGANLKAVQKLLRHSTIATTSRYAHVTDDDLRAAMERVAGPGIGVASGKVPENLPKRGRAAKKRD